MFFLHNEKQNCNIIPTLQKKLLNYKERTWMKSSKVQTDQNISKKNRKPFFNCMCVEKILFWKVVLRNIQLFHIQFKTKIANYSFFSKIKFYICNGYNYIKKIFVAYTFNKWQIVQNGILLRTNTVQQAFL